MTPFSYIRALFTIVILAMVSSSLTPEVQAEALMYRPGQEYRSLNTGAYEIAIQKNGRIDVGLSTGEAVYLNAFPMVWFDGKEKPEVARLDGRISNRFEVNDRLGRGQGMRIQHRQHRWTLRTYPTKPFFAVQFTYTNTAKKPVTIKQLIPWAIGDPKKGSVALGEKTLDSILLVDTMSSRQARRVIGEGTSPTMMAVFNPATGRSLLAGFITQDRGYGEIQLAAHDVDPEEPNQLDYMRAITIFDPPITLQPGESLDSEILYLAIAETNAQLAMERYAKGVAVTNQIPIYPKAPPRTFEISPSGTDSLASYAQKIIEAAKVIQAKTSPSENIQLVIQPNWSSDLGKADPELKAAVDAVHAMGFKIGFHMNPFVFEKERFVSEHPDWGIPYTTHPDGAVSKIVIDITHPDARQWFEATLREFKQTYAFDSLFDIGPFVFMEVDTFSSGNTVTKIEIARFAMSSLRAGVGDSMPLVARRSDYLPIFPNTHFYENTLDPAMFYLAPHLGQRYARRDSGGVESPYVLGDAKAFLQGSTLIEYIESIESFTQFEPSVFSPSLIRPAKPDDLFFSDSPSVWLKEGLVKTGNWMLAGIQNDSEAPKTITLPLGSNTSRIQPRYTLFDVDQGRYFGVAQNQININVPSHSARVLLLREVKKQPLVVGSTYPLADTMPPMTNERWDSSTGSLSGSITTRDTAGTLYLIIPKSFKPKDLHINGEIVPWKFNDDLLHIPVPKGTSSPVNWSLTFTR